jgi:hypothetical protein
MHQEWVKLMTSYNMFDFVGLGRNESCCVTEILVCSPAFCCPLFIQEPLINAPTEGVMMKQLFPVP